jgi:transposase
MRPLFVREPSATEKHALQSGLHSSSAFTVRRCQILLSSVQKKTPRQIAAELHCSDQAVRNAIRAFEREGPGCLSEKTHARHDPQSGFDDAGLARLKEMIQLSPRVLGHETSLWTLALLAETCWQEGLSSRQMSGEAVGRALKRIDIDWRRAKRWVRSPDAHYEHRKKDATD